MAIETAASHAPTSGVDRMPPVVLGVVLFICSEAIFFSALFASWFTARSRAPQWPPHGVDVSPTIGAIACALLVLSSATIAMSQSLLRRGDYGAMQDLLRLAAMVALVAIAAQCLDLAQLNFSVNSNGFGTVYWTTEVVDIAHVAGAVIFGLLVLGRARAGALRQSNPELMRACVIFWHFVVGISIFTFFVLEVVSG